ncbi:alpha/beta hydrolase [Bacillus massiliigorillae]|uniref:alpha/beta hydrolase n=1 Tax=Bacillus massiliigorillae TaxID=1243664 RepID=UPI0003AB24CD|nr:alpha/beta fold hydrolase [Bacillus massiliigorillae]
MKKIGCLCIHGFTGAPFEVEPLAEYFRFHTNWEIVVPTLPGHGENGDLSSIQYMEWIACAEDALQQLFERCEEIFVVGFSMGGIIACNLAKKYPVKKLVLLSAAAKYISAKQLSLDIKDVIKDSFRGNIKDNELYKRYTTKIKQTPLHATGQFRTLVAANAKVFKDITIPVFIAQGRRDGIVPPKTAGFLYRKLASDYKVVYIDEEAKHLICHSPHNETLFHIIQQFLLKEK